MTDVNEVYKCNVCGNIVEVLHSGKGELVCCGEAMKLMQENTVDAAKEKHVPVVDISGNEVYVKVGEVEHPSDEKHHIEWIEVVTDKRVYRKVLKAGDKPEARFMLRASESVVLVREYCNLHGLWRK
jgi:superoxide reductase